MTVTAGGEGAALTYCVYASFFRCLTLYPPLAGLTLVTPAKQDRTFSEAGMLLGFETTSK